MSDGSVQARRNSIEDEEQPPEDSGPKSFAKRQTRERRFRCDPVTRVICTIRQKPKFLRRSPEKPTNRGCGYTGRQASERYVRLAPPMMLNDELRNGRYHKCSHP